MIPTIPSWLIISGVLLVVLIILFRTANQVYLLSLLKNNFFYIVALSVFIFLAFSLITIHNSNPDIDLTSAKGIGKVMKVYASWGMNVLSNMGRITGYAVQQDWFNATNSTN